VDCTICGKTAPRLSPNQQHCSKECADIARLEAKFGGNYRAVLRRDGYQCRRCGNETELHIHHINGKGNRRSGADNSLGNLITLCKFCHVGVHWHTMRRLCEIVGEETTMAVLEEYLSEEGIKQKCA
jgi:5-methylcytosine-specific restriction endonuclease McrA